MIADLEEINGEEAFKAMSYRRAADYISKMSEAIEDTASRDALQEIPGVGRNIAQKIKDIIGTGTTKHLEDLLTKVPEELLELLKIPGLGPRTASRLYRETGVTGIGDLEAALKDGRVAALKGFGQRRVQALEKGLHDLGSRDRRHLLAYAWPVAEEIAQALMSCAPGVRAEVAGSIRRRKETVGDVDIVAACNEENVPAVARCFLTGRGIGEVLAGGPTKCSIRLDGGMQVDLRIVRMHEFTTALHHFTGSKEHHVHLRGIAKDLGLKINEYGVFKEEAGSAEEPVPVKDESELYRLLGMDYVPPEMREDTGEVEAALESRLPSLVETEDILGDLHIHSNFTDGIDSIERLARAAASRGYEYIAITDHSKALAFARGLDEERLSQQAELIDSLNKSVPGLRILKGIEVDILAGGKMDLPDDALRRCDVVVASIHSGFRNDQEQIYSRLEGACKNPHVDIIGHPTGRIIGQRDPYPLDMPRLVDLAKKTGTVLEINASPDRLDMSDQYARACKQAGVRCSIDTDAHSLRGLDDIRFGIDVARRGWLGKDDVLNTKRLHHLLAEIGK